eukprot:gnl/TRDRNA2_/TRDRNA2_185328_c0_seq1.p1 gnl/TRDRNA2_/TRDRNA2_185328_c0~~gnl/TRDRNA2_/TRDRNA2_185328_c0_seq1.p1  ORF type:complete len:896 (+),score=168.88 gnl/TRDRNA2_/TRDRNA2_185328_c0_seq1:353-2689(+)
MTVDGVECSVASLKHGDAYGWFESELAMFTAHGPADADEEIWAMCKPQVVVEEKLRVARLTEDPIVLQHTLGAGAGLNHAALNETKVHCDPEVKSRLGSLWTMAGATEAGLVEQGGLIRAHFFASLWLPLFDLLEGLKEEMHDRIRKKYKPYDCFPMEGHQIAELRSHVGMLTKRWYGSTRGGNLSTFFRWFIESMNIIGVTAYKWETIPVTQSPDGWATMVDNAPRAAALKAKAAAPGGFQTAAAQKQGRSAIDNTVLRNIFTPREARDLLIGRRLRKALCCFIRIRQQLIIRKISERLKLDVSEDAKAITRGHGHRSIQFLLRSVPCGDFEALKIDPDGLCCRMLIAQGSPLVGYGQLTHADQAKLETVVSYLLDKCGWENIKSKPAQADSEDAFERFVAWARDHPGDYFEQDKRHHAVVQMLGLLSKKLVIVKRSAMERLTMARYFTISWQRTQPLWGVKPTNHEAFQVRPGDISESSSIRVNECPYAKLHGMALSAGGFAADNGGGSTELGKRRQKARYSLLKEMQWVQDPSANIENWGLTDIEKIVQEAWQMNPHGPVEMRLPGECFVYVGQNPKVGSSIQKTQHTQLCEASAKSYPMAFMTTSPRWSTKLNAYVDLVDMGPSDRPEDQRGSFMKISTKKPAAAPIMDFLVGLRIKLLVQYGGGDNLDFLCGCMSDEDGGFFIIFAPIAQLMKLEGVWTNIHTGESATEAGLDEPRIDFGKGVGHYLVERDALKVELQNSGEDTIRKVYAFNRVPNLRESIEKYMAEFPNLFD